MGQEGIAENGGVGPGCIGMEKKFVHQGELGRRPRKETGPKQDRGLPVIAEIQPCGGASGL